MTTSDKAAGGVKDPDGDEIAAANLERLTGNLKKAEALSQRLISVMSQKEKSNPALSAPDQDLFNKATTSYWS